MRSKTYNKKNDTSKKSKKVRKDTDLAVIESRSDKSAPTANLKRSGRDNDPNWYFTSPELANQASQLSFQNFLGYGSAYGYEVPTITRINTVMNPGVTYRASKCMHSNFSTWDSATLESLSTIDPGKAGVNMMAAKLYTTLSSFTGRTASYAPQDVAMMILQISSIAEISEAIRRMFGIALTYNARNRVMPLGLLKAMGLAVPNFIQNLSVYRMRFNVAMSRINQIPLLENIAFIKKSRDIYQKVYMDDPTNMSQLFFYLPKFYFVLDEAGDSEGSILRANSFISSNATMATLLTRLEEMITAALESSTLNFIYADLLNMANKLNVTTWQFDYLAENYIVMPEYNANALLQFHNLTIMGNPLPVTDPQDVNKGVKGKISYYANAQGLDVYITNGADVFCNASTNDIVYNPAFDAAHVNQYAWMVDMPTDNPSIEDRIEALRYTSCNFGNIVLPSSIQNATLSVNAYVHNVLPDHYVADVYTYSNIDYAAATPSAVIVDSTIDVSDQNLDLDTVTLWSQFEHAPLRGVMATAGGGLKRVIGGLQYFTLYDCYYVQRLLDIMMSGLWDFRV